MSGSTLRAASRHLDGRRPSPRGARPRLVAEASRLRKQCALAAATLLTLAAPSRRATASLAAILALAILLTIAPTLSLFADDVQQTRTRAGLRFFRTLLAADLGIVGKTVDEGRLLLLVYYTKDRKQANELAKNLGGANEKDQKIKGLPLVVEVTSDPSLAAYAKRKPAGIFLAQPPDGAALGTLIRYGIDNHVIVYSPFEGHVERGVLGGISVEAQVRPYLNRATLEASRITLKALVLEASKVYQ